MLKSLASGTFKTIGTVVVVGAIMVATVPTVDLLQDKIKNTVSSSVSNEISTNTNNGIGRFCSNIIGNVTGTVVSNFVPITTQDFIILKVAQVADNGPVYVGAFNRWWNVKS